MPTVVATAHNHDQPTSALIWEIEHNLNVTFPVVECFILVDGAYMKAIPADVISIDAMNIEVHWTEARAGKARII